MSFVKILREVDINAIFLIEAQTPYSTWTKQTFEKYLNPPHQGFGLFLADKLVAFIIITTLFEEMHILNIAVEKNFQRKGYATLLIKHVINLAKEKNHYLLSLEVRRSNYKAIGLYDRLGFIEASVRKNYYLSNNGKEDALILIKDLRADDC